MTDEQLRILVGAIMHVEGALVSDSMSYATRFIAAARASSPPAAHTDSPHCQCVDCLKRDARRWRKLTWHFTPVANCYRGTLDAYIAAEDAKARSK